MDKTTKIYFDLPEGVYFDLKSENSSDVISSENKLVSVNTSKDNADFTLNQIRPKFSRLKRIILFLFTFPFQGIFNIIFLNVDGNWYKNICPYFIKAKFTIQNNINKASHLKYIPSDAKKMPQIQSDNATINSVQYFPCFDSVYDSFFKFCNRFLSVSFTAILIFVIFGIIALHGSNPQNSVFFIVMMSLSAAVLLLSVLVLIHEYLRLTKIIKNCNK